MTRADQSRTPAPPASATTGRRVHFAARAAELSPLRKAAILLVSLEQPLAQQLLARLDRAAVEAVTLEIARLERIAPADHHAVSREFVELALRRMRFAFDDVIGMPADQLRAVFHRDDGLLWARALAGTEPAAKSRVLAGLDPAAAAALNRAIAQIGPVRLDEVEAAQADLTERLRNLFDQGRITLPDPEGQEEIVV